MEYLENLKALALKTELSQEDYTWLVETIEKEKLPIQIVNSRYGFSVAWFIWDNIQFPGQELEPICGIDYKQFPFSKNIGWIQNWEVFSKIPTDPRNIELLKYYGLELPKSVGYYEY